VLLEASHGDRAQALRLAWEVWRQAPSVTSADALGWALTRAGRPRAGLLWAHRALRLGTRSPSFHYHAGIAARGASRPDLARRHLRRALRLNPAFSPLEAPSARRALAAL
jgi:Flp pilus assembly protein TadD